MSYVERQYYSTIHCIVSKTPPTHKTKYKIITTADLGTLKRNMYQRQEENASDAELRIPLSLPRCHMQMPFLCPSLSMPKINYPSPLFFINMQSQVSIRAMSLLWVVVKVQIAMFISLFFQSPRAPFFLPLLLHLLPALIVVIIAHSLFGWRMTDGP